MIGSVIVKTLLAANEKSGLNLKILLLVRDEAQARKDFNNCNIEYYQQDICDMFTLTERVDFIIHCAASTASKNMITNPIGTMEVLVNGTQNMLKTAHNLHVKSMVYLSSMEVYGSLDEKEKEADESCLGYIDLSNPRSSYPEGKRLCECMCNCYAYQLGVPVKMVRLSQVFGAGTKPTDTRVFAQFARSVIKKENIILHTSGSSIGNYCYISDAIKGILIVLLKGTNGETYNICNENNTMSIKQMAELVCNEVAENNIKVQIQIPQDRENMGYAPATNLRMRSKKLAMLGWKPKYLLPNMYKRMLADWSQK